LEIVGKLRRDLYWHIDVFFAELFDLLQKHEIVVACLMLHNLKFSTAFDELLLRFFLL
jgi:hypothetical protein